MKISNGSPGRPIRRAFSTLGYPWCSLHAAAMESRLPIEIQEGPSLKVQADRTQIEQALINIVKNAVEASLETGGTVQVSWSRRADSCEVLIQDEGPGMPDSANLFA